MDAGVVKFRAAYGRPEDRAAVIEFFSPSCSRSQTSFALGRKTRSASVMTGVYS